MDIVMSDTTSKGYYHEFDALRAVAAISVMIAHFAGDVSFLVERLGLPAVVLFFCLSGYLITGILLRCRELSSSQSNLKTLLQFYVRRALRIFPLYYLVVFLFCLVSPSIRSNILWFLCYAVNIGKAFGETGFNPLNHFWTLAVEEQFYIVWPFVILLSPAKRLSAISLSMLGVAFLSRYLLSTVFDASPTAVQQLTFSSLDALGLGSFFAVVEANQAVRLSRLDRFSTILLCIFWPLMIVLFAIADNATLSLWGPLIYSLSFAPLIYLVARSSGSDKMSALRSKPLLFVGKISYGIYVWHLPVMWAYAKLMSLFFGYDLLTRLHYGVGTVVRTTLLIVMTLVISSCSWYFFEKPINSLKSKFPYMVK